MGPHIFLWGQTSIFWILRVKCKIQTTKTVFRMEGGLRRGNKRLRTLSIDEIAKKQQDEWPKHPEDDLCYISKGIVSWAWLLIELATQRPLTFEDVPPCPKSYNVKTMSSRFWAAWADEEERTATLGKRASLFWTLWAAYKTEFFIGTLSQLVFCMTQFAQPYLIASLVGWIVNPEGGVQTGLTLALGLAVVSTTSSIMMSFNLFSMRRTGLAVRSGTVMACYEQVLQLTSTARASLTVGKTTSMIAIDCEKLLLASMFTGYLWHGPLAALIAMFLLVREVGWIPAMAGMAWICILIPTQTYIASRIGAKRRQMIACTDERVKQTNEILGAIRAIKFYNWEVPLAARTLASRAKETGHLFMYLCTNGVLRELLFISGPICSVVIFSLNTFLLDKPMTLVQVFRVLAMVNVLRFPLNLLGQALKFWQDAAVSCERLNSFFLLPTRREEAPGEEGADPVVTFKNASFSWTAVSAANKSSSEEAAKAAQGGYEIVSASEIGGDAKVSTMNVDIEDKSFRLKNLNLNFGGSGEGSKLIAIIGSVGCGKSSLLQAVLGEIPMCADVLNTGESLPVTVKGQLAYCSQQPWIQNLTLRDNVCFGYDYAGKDPTVRVHYEAAIAAAALLPDIEILRQGDLTEIGERGVNLSGGQKARVSIARALFIAQRRANICLLDDPFSAVDGNTGSAIFHAGVRRILCESSRTRIVIVCLNSHLHLLPYFDRIILLDAGSVVADGSPSNLAAGPQAGILAATTGIEEANFVSLVETAAQAIPTHNLPVPTSVPAPSETSTPSLPDSFQKIKEGNATVKTLNAKIVDKDAKMTEAERLEDGRVIVTEKREIGAVKWRIYLDYFGAAFWPPQTLSSENIFTTKLMGNVSGSESSVSPSSVSTSAFITGLLIAVGMLVLFVLAQAARVSVDYTLARWAEAEGDRLSPWCLAFYISFGILAILLSLRSVYLNYWTCQSTQAVHIYSFNKIMQAPVTEFFDTHTVGEVLNKFSRDTEVMDSSVPEFLLQFCINVMQVTFTFGICLWSSPYMAIGFLPMCYLFWRASQVFACVSRDLKRMESVTRSPIFSSLSETLGGLDTIRAYGDSNRFLRNHEMKTDKNCTFNFHIWMCTSWMTIRLELATSLVLMSVSLFAVFMRQNTNAVALGLALSYGMQLTALFQRCVQLGIDVGVYMTSVERVMEYMGLPQEQSVLKKLALPVTDTMGLITPGDVELTNMNPKGNKPIGSNDKKWPRQGAIEFQNVTFQYRDNPPALRDLSFSIRSGERIGVCGRTGAGKSSIMFALFRMAEISSGEILVDNCNIAHDVPLCLLRQGMAIIPQDPVLLTGSIRFQLDPFGDYTDENVLQALDTVSLSETIKAMPGGLDEAVAEGGSNLSHGQRQLICIARALLRDTRILVVDEGTSAVDPMTDSLIQTALRNASKKRGTTVLAIAHRLQTIRDFDRILVMGDGRLLEYDTPTNLMADTKSHFYDMLQDGGEEEQPTVS